MSWYFNSETVCRVMASLGVSRQYFRMTAAALALFVSCGRKDAGQTATTESRMLAVSRSSITLDDTYGMIQGVVSLYQASGGETK